MKYIFFAMFRNQLRITLRSISRQKFYTLINITGLTLGITTSLLIGLYIIDEFSFDRFHTEVDQMYRVDLRARLSDQYMDIAYTSSPIASAFVDEIPEIIDACRIAFQYDVNLGYEEEAYTEKKVLLADSNFFEFFSFRLLHGDIKQVLKQPNSIVLTETSANKLFGFPSKTGEPPLGKIVEYGPEAVACVVTGIAEDPPHNSHIQYNMILSMQSWELSRIPDWTNNVLLNYVKLDKKADPEVAQEKLPDMVNKYIAPIVKAYMGIEFEDFLENGGMYKYVLEPVKRIHLFTTVDDTVEPRGSINSIYILSAIVFFILVIACINFMNLSTARYANRGKEVGVRKSLGASRNKLVQQFLNESIFFSFLAMILSIIILFFILPYFNTISGKELYFVSIIHWRYMIVLAGIVIIVGLLAGSYPSVYLTAFKPTEVLRGRIKAGLKSGGIRSGLVVFQFAISMILITATLLIFRQLNLLENRDLGFDKENILVLNNVNALENNKKAFKDAVLKIPGIIHASITTAAPPSLKYSSIFTPKDGSEQEIGMTYCIVDEDYLKTMNIEMAVGRSFSKDIPTDSNAVIINEAAARKINWEMPVGEQIDTKSQPGKPDYREVIGVVKDFNFQTLRKEISPLIIFMGSEGNMLLIRMMHSDYQDKIAEIEKIWKSLAQGTTFDYAFIDAEFDALYKKDQQLGKIILLFTTMAILIASLGLIGLAAYTAQQRSKEIGIRKTLGASSLGIIGMLSTEYFRLLAIAFVLAVPVSYFLIDWWLNNFAFKIEINAFSFLIGGAIALLVALLSVFYQSIRAANKNPVDSLKYE